MIFRRSFLSVCLFALPLSVGCVDISGSDLGRFVQRDEKRFTVDGKPESILPVNLMFRGVVLSAGAHVVEYTYQPDSLSLGIVMSFLGLVALVVILVLAGRPMGPGVSTRRE